MNLKLFIAMVKQMAEEKKILFEELIEIIEKAMVFAYCKDYGEKSQNIRAKIDLETGNIKFWQEKLVVDESIVCEVNNKVLCESEIFLSDIEKEDIKEDIGLEINLDKKIVFDPEKHIFLEEAIKIKPDIKVEEILKKQLPSYENFTRIAAQVANQIIIQEIRSIERENIFQKYIKKQGEIVVGIIERISQTTVFVNIGLITAFLPKHEQIPNEFYTVGQRLKSLILKVEKNKEVIILLSRAHPDFILKLFLLEVPEINLGQVEIKNIVRNAGFRSKIAVSSVFQSIDPIGALVGLRGHRIDAVIKEIGGEKIDVILWVEDQKQMICNALLPAKVLSVEIDEKEKKALVFLDKNQISLAIGKEGQNVRLASKITGYDIDIKEAKQDVN